MDTKTTVMLRTVRGITIGFSIAVLLLLGIAVVIIHSVSGYQTLSKERTNARTLMLEMRDLLSDVQNAETGQRGYLLTGDERYLSPYLAARGSIPARLNHISELAEPYHSTMLDIQHVRLLITNKLSELEQTIELRRERGYSAAQRVVETGSGKKIMDDIRLLLGDQGKEIERILEIRILQSETNGERVLLASTFAGCISMTLLIVSFFGLRREIQGRQQAEQKLMLKEHNERLLLTLEERNVQLEQANHTLATNEALLSGQKKVLELIATGAPLGQSLTALLRVIEIQSADMLCSILLLDADGIHVRHGAASSLPEEFAAAFNGQSIGPVAGSCGTAAYLGKPVFVEDIATDPLWEKYRAVALPYGLRACWSTPIMDEQQRVLGTFAVYYRKPGRPTELHLRLIAIATHIAAIAIGKERAEMELRQVGTLLHAVADGATDAIFVKDQEGRYLFFNQAASRFVGRSASEVIGRDDAALFDQAGARLVMDRDRAVRESGLTQTDEETLTAAGIERTYLATKSPYRDAQGKIVGTIGISHDITERRLAEEKLRESEEQLRLALDAAHMGIFDWDVKNNRITWSHGHEELWGLKHGEFDGTYEAFAKGVHPDDLPVINAEVERCIAAKERFGCEYRVVWPDNSVHWVAGVGEFTFDDNGEPVRMLGAVLETTARRRAEQEMRDSELRLRIVTDNAGVGLVVICPTRRYLYSNAAYSKMFKLPTTDLVGKRVADVLHTVYESQIRPRLDCAFAGERVSYELLRKTDEGEFHYAVSYEPARSNGAVTNVVVVVIDITERKRAELTLRESEDYAQRLAATQSAIFDALPAHIALVDSQGIILSVNQPWRRFATVNSLKDPTFSIGKDYLQICQLAKGEDEGNAREVATGIQQVLSGESASFAAEYACHSPDEQRWFRLIVTPLHENKRDGAVIMHVDITERQKAEQRFSAFATLGRRLNAAPDVETAARIIADLADDLFGWDAYKLDLYDENTDLCQSLLTIDILDGRRQDVAPAYANQPPSPRMRRVMQDGPLLILRENPLAAMHEVRPFGDVSRPSASIMFVPVTEGRKVIGVLSIQSYTPNAYTQADLNALQDLTDHCAGALERLRGRDALRASEQRLRSILDTMFVFVGLMNLDGELLEVNQAPLEAAGLKREEVLGKTVAETYWFSHSTEMQKQVRQALARSAQGEVVREDYSIQIAGGQTIVIDTTFAPLRDASGRVTQIVGSAVDVTARKQAEEILHRTEQLYRRAIVGAGAVPYDYDYATRSYTFMGAEIEDLTGYRAEEICGPLWVKIIQENIVLGDAAGLSVAEATQKVLRGEIPQWRSDIRIRTLAGDTRWLSDVSVQKLDAEGRVIGSMGILQDITERKLAEQKLAESSVQLRALLKRLQRAQEEERIRVARYIHDELGQLLTGLKMDVRWLERKLAAPGLPTALNPLLDRAVAASELSDQTIAVVQKIAADLRPGTLDRLGLAAALTEKARRFEERTGIPCHVTIVETAPNLPQDVATELFYICQEALTNVTRHARASEVRVLLDTNNKSTTLEVVDNGCGIRPEDLTAAQSLGLTGIRERAAHCGGTVTWERCDPTGTWMKVQLPAQTERRLT